MSSLEQNKSDHNKTDEFNAHESILGTPKTRRTFMKLMGASMALAGLTGCSNFRKPEKTIIPYAKQPENLVHGVPNFYATTIPNSVSRGIIAESHEGRPTKLEGNPEHPTSSGYLSAQDQASILDLYSPDRLQHITHNEKETSESKLKAYLNEIRRIYKGSGDGLAFLIDSRQSPTVIRKLKEIQAKYPKVRFYNYNPSEAVNRSEGLRLVTNTSIQTSYNVEKATTILALGSDFLGLENTEKSDVTEFAKRRDPNNKNGLNRLYSFESNVSVTGMKADHRFSVTTDEITQVLHHILNHFIDISNDKNLTDLKSHLTLAPTPGIDNATLTAIIKDLEEHRGKSIVIGGDNLPASSHALIYILNDLLGNHNQTIHYYKDRRNRSLFKYKNDNDSIIALKKDIKKNAINTLFILGGNPAYNTPGDLNLKALLKKVPQTLHLTLFENETTVECNWKIPKDHFLETWSDTMTKTGQRSIVQPLISPLYNSINEITLLNTLLNSQETAYDSVRKETRKFTGSNSFENRWKKYLHNGIINKRSSKISPSLQLSEKLLKQLKQLDKTPSSLSILIKPDYKINTGEFITNPWLQELPDPITKLTWDNAAHISPELAKKQSLKNGDIVELNFGLRKITVPVLIIPGTNTKTIVLTLGYGQSIKSKIGGNIGYNAYHIFNSKYKNGILKNIKVIKLNKEYPLALSQTEESLNGRPVYRSTTEEALKKNPNIIKERTEYPPLKSLWKEQDYSKGYQWGMTIDMSKCTGCSSCIVACQSENNIPVVGKEEVINGRIMHWLRMDRYFDTSEKEVSFQQQPMACVHCETAPCEQVCPVSATVHDEEGLNVMVYNRCVGTRYCSNNCPYKVRRFNFFDWHQKNPTSVKKEREHFFDYIREPAKPYQQQFNPDVTVRMRGIMEKCTYCIQRISQAKSNAKNENRSIKDGDVITACQQTCASEAITFGNINDPNSAVSKTRQEERAYAVLAELNLKPRTLFLAAINNPNPVLVKTTQKGDVHGHHD